MLCRQKISTLKVRNENTPLHRNTHRKIRKKGIMINDIPVLALQNVNYNEIWRFTLYTGKYLSTKLTYSNKNM